MAKALREAAYPHSLERHPNADVLNSKQCVGEGADRSASAGNLGAAHHRIAAVTNTAELGVFRTGKFSHTSRIDEPDPLTDHDSQVPALESASHTGLPG